MGRSPVRHGSDAGEELVLTLVREQAGELLRFARRLSICVEDAQDAYQRTLEKLVRRVRSEPPEHAGKWVRTVLRHEALAIRAEREQQMGRTTLEDERHRDAAALDPAERVERFERLAHTAEALRGLKPQEVTALALRAEGLSYKEICARTGWSYTRCNRAVSEGRRALLERLRAIESGAECERWLPLLSLLADGEANASELAQLRPHLRACPACRATLRRFHMAPQQVAALLPVALVPAVAGVASVATAGFTTAPADAVAAAPAAGEGAVALPDAFVGDGPAALPDAVAGEGSAALPDAFVGAGAAPGAAEDVAARGFGFGRHLEAALHNLAERANTTVLRFHSAIDALPNAKLAAVAASTVAVAGGGAAIEQAATADGGAGNGAATAAVVAATDPTPASATPISTGSSAPQAPAPTTTTAAPSSAAGVSTSMATSAAGTATGQLAEFALEPFASASASADDAPSQGVFSTAASAVTADASSGSAGVPAGAPSAGVAVFPAPSMSSTAAGLSADSRTEPQADDTTTADPLKAPAPPKRRPAAPRREPGTTPHPGASAAPPPAEFPATPPPRPAPAPQPASNPQPAAPSGAEFAGP